MKTKSILTFVFSVVMGVCAGGAATRAEPVAPSIDIKAKPFPMKDVRVLDGPFKTAMEKNKEYLLKLDADRMLWPYHDRAGMKTTGERYGGWEARDCVGHVSGHYLSACSLMYASTGDERLKKRVDHMVAEIAKAQAQHGNGYAGPVRPEVWTQVFDNKFGRPSGFGLAGGYVPWYVLHKTFAGLIDAYGHAGNKQALDVAVKMGRWAKKGLDNLDDARFQAMLACEWGGMGDSLAKLYTLSGDKDCLTLARRFDQKSILDPLAEKKDNLSGLHINTQMPKIIGSARLYEIEGKDRDRTITRQFWDLNMNTQMFAPGGFGVRERYRKSGSEKRNLAWNAAETCCTYNMLKLARRMFSWDLDPKYMDYYERGLYNHILGSQEPETGGVTYFYSLKPGHFKVYSTPFDSMWCCVGTGIENHSKYGDTIYFHGDDTLFVNLFIPSKLNWEGKGVKVIQETKFPENDTTTLTIATKKPQAFALSVRVPYWTHKGAQITVNGERQNVAMQPGTYASVRRTWQDGDVVKVTLPMNLRLYRARDDKNLVVVMYGPLVLAGELGREGMPESSCIASGDTYGMTLPPPVPMLVFEDDDPSTWLRPVEGRPLTWRTDGAGKPQDVTLSPLGLLHNQRYNVYWNSMTPEQWKAKFDLTLKPATVSADKLKPGIAYNFYQAGGQMPDFSKIKPDRTGILPQIDPEPQEITSGKDKDHYAMLFTGYLKVTEPGEYIFGLNSDDGSRLWIDDHVVLDNDSIQLWAYKPEFRHGMPVKLEAGYYPIKIGYFEIHYNETLELVWRTKDTKDGWKQVPKEVLFHY